MSSTAPRPNTFLLGVAKAGSTSLARYLAQHPDVFLPAKKETNFHLVSQQPLSDLGPAKPRDVHFLLNRYSVADAAAFERLYAGSGDRRVRLDSSVRYLYHPVALEAIAREVPDPRHIVVLRDPVERIVSHWRMNRFRYQLEPLSLADALAAEDQRVEAGWGWDWHYRRVSTYAPQLERLFALFPKDQVLVLLYGDFVRDPGAVLERCFDFLGVRSDVRVDRTERGMVPTEPRWPLLEMALSRPTLLRGLLRRVPGDRGMALARQVQHWNARPPSPVDLRPIDGVTPSFDPDRAAVAKLLGLDEHDLATRMSASPHRSVPS